MTCNRNALFGRRWALSLSLALALLVSASTLTANEPLFLCPSGRGICSWSTATQWRSFMTPRSHLELDSFLALREGGAVALFRGHQEPGTLRVFSSEGRAVLTRSLDQQTALEALVGDLGRFGVALCADSAAWRKCDTMILSSTAASMDQEIDFPNGCLFPRLSSGAVPTCLKQEGAQTSVMTLDHAGRFVLAGRLPEASFRQMVPWGKNGFLLTAGSSLLEWNGSTSRGVSLGGDLLWLESVAADIVFAAVHRENETGAENVLLELRHGGDAPHVAWSSPSLVPRVVRSVGRGRIIVDAWGQGVRRLTEVKLGGVAANRVLWEVHDEELWR